MTLSAKTIRTGLAAAIAAATVLTAVAVPAQAEYQRAPHVKRKITKLPKYQPAPHAKRKITRMKGTYAVKCWVRGSNDVKVVYPFVTNISGKTIPSGAQIRWRMNFIDGSTARTGTYILAKPFYPGEELSINQVSLVGFRCVAAAFI